MKLIGARFAEGLVGLLLLGTFVFPDIAGTWSTYISLVLCLVLMLWALVWPPRASYDLGAWFFVASWSLIAIAFMVTNAPGQTDFLLAINFVMFVLYPLLRNALQRFAHPRNSLIVASLALAGTAISFVFGAYEIAIEHLPRAEGYEANPIRYGSIALLLGFVALLGMFVVKAKWRYIFLAGPLLGVATVVLSGSRGPLLVLPALITLCLVMLPVRRAFSVAAVLLLLVGSGAAIALKPEALARFTVIPGVIADIVTGRAVPQTLDVSSNVRYTILRGSIEAFKRSPWIGYGWAEKTTVVAKYNTWNVGFGNPKTGHLHSDILNLGVSAGLVGLLAYALALLAPLASLWKAPRDSQQSARIYVAWVLTLSYAIAGAVNLMFGFELMTTLYVVCAAIFSAFCRDAPEGGAGS